MEDAPVTTVNQEVNISSDYASVAEVVTDKETGFIDNLIDITTATDSAKQAKLKGYEGEQCTSCNQFTLVRNGSCLKCVSCGETSGCS